MNKATWNGHLAVVRLLLSRGAQINARDNDGYTLPTKAKEQKRDAVIAYLRSHGAKTGGKSTSANKAN